MPTRKLERRPDSTEAQLGVSPGWQAALDIDALARRRRLRLEPGRLADAAASGACKDFSAFQAAVQMDAMLDRSSLSRREYNLRRLRYKAAQLYVKAGNLDLGLAQAKLAYLDGNIDAPIPVLIAQIEIARGNFPEATRMLDAASAKVSKDDILGKQFIAGLRAQIRDARAHSPPIR